MHAAVVCAIVVVIMNGVAPPIVHRNDLARLAPPSTWRSAPLKGLDAELVTLPTKGASRYVVKGDWAAVASVEGAAPLFVPLTKERAALVVDALEDGVAVDVGAIDRVERAGFAIARPLPPEPPRYPFSFARLELRHADSAPELVHVLLDLDEQGHVDRSEHVVAHAVRAASGDLVVDVGAANAPLSAKTAPVDRSAEIARFVAAVRAKQ